MARAFAGEHEVTLGDEKFTLRLGLRQLEELEARLGTGIIAIVLRYTNGQASIKDTREILRQGFIGAGMKKTDAEIGALIEKTGVRVMYEAAALLSAVMKSGDDAGNAEAAGSQ